MGLGEMGGGAGAGGYGGCDGQMVQADQVAAAAMGASVNMVGTGTYERWDRCEWGARCERTGWCERDMGWRVRGEGRCECGEGRCESCRGRCEPGVNVVLAGVNLAE